MGHPEDEDSHRVLNVHHNVPGVLRDVNRIISDLDANIKAQVPPASFLSFLIIVFTKLQHSGLGRQGAGASCFLSILFFPHCFH